VQKELDLPERLLIGDVVTRWGAKFAMIDRYLEQEEAIRRVLSVDRKASHLLPSWQTLDVLKSVHKALSPLAEFTNALSGETYTTVSGVLPMLSVLRDVCDERQDEDTTALTSTILENVRVYLETKYADERIQELLAIAAFLDPRYRMDFLSGDGLMTDDYIKRQVIDRAAMCAVQVQQINVSETHNEDTDIQPPTKKISLTERLKQKRMEKRQAGRTDTPEEKARKEVENYLAEPSYDGDCLAWWKVNKAKYLLLSSLVTKYLCIPATSTPSERLFSYAGQVITSKRNKLNPQRADTLIFLNCNL
jgi:hypothetical protein